jgi:2-polyprenyl-3-methyl-5-hydroxy-6-metoxy-1,4-benzoquinol methylase
MSDSEGPSTAGTEYADRLVRLQNQWWKRLLNVQAPWQWNLRRLKLGRTIDVGCGIGRNLISLGAGSVGVDHNAHSIATARRAGFTAFTVDEFFASPDLTRPGSYDSMLVAHVIEHLTPDESAEVIASYLPLVKPGGRIVWICPQERGFRSDSTHITFTDFAALRALADRLGVEFEKQYSFPFPRPVGRIFTYNEFDFIGRMPAA